MPDLQLNARAVASTLSEGLITARLLVRPPREADGPAVYLAVVESLTELRRFPASLPWAVQPPSIVASTEFCVLGAANSRSLAEFPFLFLERNTGRLGGSVGLHRIDWARRDFELGFWCRTSMAGNGYTQEAVHAAVDFAFGMCGATRVHALPDIENAASRGVLRACGFHQVAELAAERRTPLGELRNTAVYERVRAQPR